MTKRWIWLAVAVALGAAGCSSDKKDGAGGTAEAGGGGGGGGKAVPKVDLPPGVDRLLAALPMDSEIVVSIDVGKLRSSALLGSLLDTLSKANADKVGFDMNAECGIDPTKVVGNAMVGVKMTSGSSGEISIAFSGMQDVDLKGCIEKARSKIEANKAKLTVDGNYIFLDTEADGKQVHLAMTKAADGVGVVRISKEPVPKAALDKMANARGGDGLTKSPEFMTMVAETNVKATVWGLANGSSPMMARGALKFQSAFGSIDVTDGISADGRIRVKSADEASKIAKMFGGQLNSVKQMGFADLAEMKPEGADVVVKFVMRAQQVENVKNMLTMALGSAMARDSDPTLEGSGTEPPIPPPTPAPPQPATP